MAIDFVLMIDRFDVRVLIADSMSRFHLPIYLAH